MTFVKPDTMNVQARISRQTLASSLKALDFRIGFEYWCQLGTYFSKNTLRGIHRPRGAVRSVYLEAAAKDPALRVVDCSNPAGAMDSPEGIFAKICAQLAPILEADAEVQGL
jgi:hypothetical protein